MEKNSIVLNGKKISYIEEGSGHAPTVLLLHGVPESSLLWKKIIPVIVSCGFSVIAPDLPGFGQSDPFDEPSTWERYEQFISDFTSEMKMDKFHLVVHDWGGLIGLKWACDFPEKILSLVISNTTISDGYQWHRLAQIWRTPGAGEEIMKRMSDWSQFQSGMKKSIPNVDDETLNDFFQVFRTAESSRVVLELYRSGNLEKVKTYNAKLTQMDQPVTIIWGEKDPYVPFEFALKLQNECLPHAKVHIIPNAGHFIQIEVPNEVNLYIQQHFKNT
ncbi:alpha/beta hydrolase [Peribacillus cavernae]|uniref:Alpha/beta hydrolase n=1 Tax=Peribacillus cavernae TaxID=1674310 RepID=A0A3S0VMM4_9BACI|nr:alpha/beta hydrolase [Peribacillus cavernae]MDQ0220647.1 pimeloyl-ACP methyl ester carboxylesterase [Peribacillus cavernae]RUQ31106.1 alpha/beta hydrolase [Peribacillus cavernae]